MFQCRFVNNPAAKLRRIIPGHNGNTVKLKKRHLKYLKVFLKE
jgi:hypothetical protein